MGDLLCTLVRIYELLLFARAIFSYFPISPGGVAASINSFLFTVTEPILAPVRRLIPPLGMLDVSFIVVLLAIELLIRPAVCSIG